MAEAAQVLVGKYRLGERIARGGMAEIYLATTVGAAGFEKTVAIKRILTGLEDSDMYAHLFIEEARIAAQLSHANLVQIFDFLEDDGRYYMVMEYVDGLDLRTLLEGPPLPPALVAFVIDEAAKGLAHAHAHCAPDGTPVQFVHRDVSPHNILLSRAGEVKIADFGVARANNRRTKTATGVLRGKLCYMSPEQIAGKAVDHQTDVFALGVVTWEALTGRQLFDADTDFGVFKQVEAMPIEPPSRYRSEVPAALDTIVLQALERDLAKRTSSSEAIHEALTGHLHACDEQIGAAELGALVDTGRSRRRTEASAARYAPRVAPRRDSPVPAATQAQGARARPPASESPAPTPTASHRRAKAPATPDPAPFVAASGDPEQLSVWLDELQGGAGRAAYLAGTEGSGKTWLIEQLAARCKGRGWRLARAGGWRERAPEPYDLLGTLLLDMLDCQGQRGRAGKALGRLPLSATETAYLHLLLTGEGARACELSGLARRRAFQWATERAMAHLAARRPAVAAVDDWALQDEESRLALWRLAPIAPDLPIVLLATGNGPMAPIEEPALGTIELGDRITPASRGPELDDAVAALSQGQASAALRTARRALARARSDGGEGHTTAAALRVLAQAHAALGQRPKAAQHWHLAADAHAEVCQDSQAARALLELGSQELAWGHPDRAAEVARDGGRLATGALDVETAVALLRLLARAVAQGDPDGARESETQAALLAGRFGILQL